MSVLFIVFSKGLLFFIHFHSHFFISYSVKTFRFLKLFKAHLIYHGDFEFLLYCFIQHLQIFKLSFKARNGHKDLARHLFFMVCFYSNARSKKRPSFK